jgi:trigger factor
MKMIETVNEGLKRGYEVKILAADLDEQVTKKIEESRDSFQMKGFRKGQAPIALIKKLHGKSIIGDAMQETIDSVMREHFKKSGDKPAMQPNIQMTNQDWKEGDDIEVSLAYENLPTIPDTDFSKLKLKKIVTKSDKESIKEALDNLAKSADNFKPKAKNYKSKNGDQVIINFIGKINDEAFEGGSGEEYPLVLGSNSFIPGFEDQLVGKKSSDELDVNVTFPKEYGSTNLAGKDAVFQVKIISVNSPVAAKIDDALAKKFGVEDLKTLENQIKERLEAEYGVASRAVLKRDLMDKLDKMLKFDLPPSLVDNEADQIAHQLWHDENPEEKDHNHEKVKITDEHISIAKRRVKLGLLLADVGSKNKITVTESEIQSALMAKSREYPGQEQAFFDFVKKNPSSQEQLKAPIFEDKVIDFILELTELAEKTMTKDGLKKAVEALENS